MSVLQRRSAAEFESGFVMFAVLIALVVVASIGMLLTTESAMEADRSGRESEARQADYLAQGALQHALWQNESLACSGDFNLPITALGAHTYTAVATGGGTTTAYTLSVDQDAWIRSDDVDRNNSGGTQHIRYESGNTEQALYRFDLTTLPAGAQINSASAWFFLTSGQSHPEGPLTAYRITSDWTETDATWTTMAGNFDSAVLGMVVPQSAGGVWVQINLTAQVQAWVNGEPNYGILLTSRSEGTHAQYASREAAASEQPRLEVVVGAAPISPITIDAIGTLDTGITRTLGRTVSAYQAPGSAFFGPVGDVYLKQDAANQNYGASNDLWVEDPGAGGQADTSLLKFDMGLIPRGAKVTSATLELYANWDLSTAPGKSVGVHRVTRDWIEGTNDGASGTGASWNDSEPGTSWSSPGGDYDATPVVIADTPTNTTGWHQWDVTSLINGWATGAYPNQGLILMAENASTLVGFRASDYFDESQRPKLTISYACECGAACMAPQGSGTVLMAVVNPTTLVPADTWKKALFESWGYTVSVISESANQSSYDAAVATSDVAFISETVNSNSVGSKLASAAIGVVSQDGDYNSDLGFASGSSWSVSPELTVTDSGHYITQVFASGPLDIYSGSMEQLTVSGTQATGLTTLAETGGAGSLTALEQGATMSTGGSAAGRRVMLPFGRESSLSWQYLNSNGLVMLQRAIAWGMNADAGSSGSLLMVVGNAGSPAISDLDRKALIESWGYAVTFIDDGDSQANFDTAVAANDVVYIAGSGSSAEVGMKLTAATVGVLSEDIGLVDELGIAEPVFVKTGSKTIDVHNNSHYVTSGFALGEIGLWPVTTEVWIVGGALAPGLQLLAETESSGSLYPTGLAILETGAELYGGGFAAGRRVQVPWSEGSFDINTLNADGRTIMRRAIEWGADAAVPTSPLLMVVSDPASLTSQESAKKALIESWGYAVTLIDDAASPTEFVDAFAANDVVYVSGEVSDTSVGPNLLKTSLGVVNEQIALHDELLLSTSAGTNAFTNLSVVDNTHDITDGFSTGWLQITTVNQPLNALQGTLAAGLQNLAEVWINGATYDYGLAVVDIGGDLNGGEIAAGRRVQIPWGTAGFDFTTLNGNGQTIMQRAIEWAAGAGGDGGDGGGGGGGGGGPGYVELHEPWSAGSADTWQTVSLASFGVPADAVVEVAAINSWAGAEYWGGVRAVGSSLERRFLLHEAEGGGNDVVTMHVQANGSSEIQHYSDNTARVSFILLGYWTGASYVELFEPFKAGANASWREHNLGTYGVGPDQVAEIVMSQTSTSTEWLVGARHSGSSLQRRVSLHEAEGGGVDAVTMQLETDASSIVEVYAGADSVVDFHLIGYWSTPPGTYTETGGVHGQATAASTWQQADLATFGIPANSVAQFIVSNEVLNFERELGVRRVGSTLNRVIDLQEAEDGGADTASVHVNVDGSSRIEWYSASGTADRYFYPIGWWVLN